LRLTLFVPFSKADTRSAYRQRDYWQLAKSFRIAGQISTAILAFQNLTIPVPAENASHPLRQKQPFETKRQNQQT